MWIEINNLFLEFQCFCYASGRPISKVDAMRELYQPYQVVGREVTVPDVNSANASGNPFGDSSGNDDDDDDDPFKEIDDEDEDEIPNVQPEPPKFQCPKAGIFPQTDDCGKFYECIDLSDEIDDDFSWSVVQYECQSGLYFDPINWNCTHPKDIHPPRDCPGAEEEDDVDNQNSKTTTTMTTVPEDICPWAGYFVHPDDCSEFYQCVEESDGFSITRFGCPAGFIFDPNRILCVVPDEIKYKLNCTYQYNDEDGEAEEDDHDEDEDLTMNSATNSHLNQYGMNIEAIDEPELIEEDEDANDDSDETRPETITPETPDSAESTEKVEPVAESGRPDQNGQTDEPSSTTSDPEEDSGSNVSPEFTCPSDGYFPISSDCRKYVLCSDDFNTTLTCRSNEAYNSLLQECSTDWSVCPKAPTCTRDQERLTDPDTKEYYFMCLAQGYGPQSRFKVLRNRCPEYSEFDVTQQRCIPTEQGPEDRR